MADYAVTKWVWKDIQHAVTNNGQTWTQEQCEEFLENHESTIQDTMISAGWDYIDNLLASN